MNIHFIIFIAQTKSINSNGNFYQRKTTLFSVFINEDLNNESEYEIERLITKKINLKTKTRLKKSRYLIE